MAGDRDRRTPLADAEGSTPVLIVSPNLALDHILRVGSLAVGSVQSAGQELLAAGGKGVNVARGLRLLGIESTVHTVSAGAIGERVREMAAGEGIAFSSVEVPGDTRIATIIVNEQTRASTVLNPPGPEITAKDWQKFSDELSRTLARERPRFVLCTGSLPAGAPDTAYAEVLRNAHAIGAFTMLDASGQALRAGLEAAPRLVKVNQHEAREIFVADHEPRDGVSNQQLAEHLLTFGASEAVVTLGSNGALATDGKQEAHLEGLPVQTVNSTGAGDVFLAGLCAAYLEGLDLGRGLRHSVALAAASVETIRPGHFDVSRAGELLASANSLSH